MLTTILGTGGLVLTGCSAPAAQALSATPSDSPSPSAGSAPAAARSASAVSRSRTREEVAQAALIADLAGLARGPSVGFGVGVHDARNGLRLTHSWGESSFEMASTVKVDIMLGVLWGAERAGRPLTARERQLATAMIEDSDNTSASTLWNQNGAAAGMSQLWNALGVPGMTPGAAGYWGLTRTTMDGRLAVLDIVADGNPQLVPGGTAYLESLMHDVEPDQDFGVGDVVGSGEWGAVKNGWLPRSTEQGRWIINTTGIVRGPSTDLRLAVCSHGHDTEEVGIAFVGDVLKQVRSTLGI